MEGLASWNDKYQVGGSSWSAVEGNPIGRYRSPVISIGDEFINNMC